MAIETADGRSLGALARLGGLAGVRRALVATRDGLLLAATSPATGPADLDAPLIAALCGATARTLEGLDLGEPVETVVHGDASALYVFLAGPLLLAAIADRPAGAAEIRLELRRAARSLSADR